MFSPVSLECPTIVPPTAPHSKHIFSFCCGDYKSISAPNTFPLLVKLDFKTYAKTDPSLNHISPEKLPKKTGEGFVEVILSSKLLLHSALDRTSKTPPETLLEAFPVLLSDQSGMICGCSIRVILIFLNYFCITQLAYCLIGGCPYASDVANALWQTPESDRDRRPRVIEKYYMPTQHD